MRRLAFIVIFLVGVAGAFQWLSQGFLTTWEPQIRASLEDVVGRATHTHVHIDILLPSFLHRVRLINVRALDWDDPKKVIFQATEIDLTFSLINVPRALIHRKPYEAIGLVSVQNPIVRLSHDRFNSKTTSRYGSPSTFPPWFTVAWE